MKKFYYLFLAALMALTGCSESYDDSEIFDKYKDLQQEVDNLESQVDETKKLLNALANNLSILSIKETDEGFLITFSDGSTITVKHGKDGKDGKDGADGKDGEDGADGKDGENGKDGANGADGKDGKDGDSFIQSIVVGEDAVTFTLADGQVIVIPIGDKVAKNNQIFYTTTDGKKFFPAGSGPTLFGAILVSNKYENGQGVLTFDDAVTKIEAEAFKNCELIESITLPDGITEIVYCAFSGCSSLTSITIPNSVTSIGGEAFSGCSSLTSITIPNSVTSIGGSAFLHCSGLTSITISEGVTEIGYAAFRSCYGLTSITIPNSITNIGGFAFENCENLTSLYCKAITPPTMSNDALWNCHPSLQIYVPTASVDAYKAAANWSDYADKIVGYDF